jgi:hypothetical protein
MRRDGQTDMTKLIAALRNYAKAPETLLNVAGIQTCLTAPQLRESKDACYGLHRI